MRENNRFEAVWDEIVRNAVGLSLSSIMIIRDKVTGVLYFYTSGGGLTPLLDKDGKPIADFEMPSL